MTGHSKLAAAGIMTAVFLSGGIAGGAIMRLADRPAVAEEAAASREGGDRGGWRGGGDRDGPRRSGPRPPRSFMDERVFNRLVERLELSEEQREDYRGILERQRGAASTVFSEFAPRLQAVVDSTNAEFRRLLTPEQQAEFDRMIGEDRDLLGRRYRGGDDDDRERGPGR